MICSCVEIDGAVCAPLRVEPFDAERSADLAAGFKALGDPHRVAILHLLAAAGEPVCVVDVERHVDLAQSTISHHLKALVDAGVMHRERRGKWSYYSIIDQRLADLGVGIETLAAKSAAST
jgi:ArsR family transcriptional regulator